MVEVKSTGQERRVQLLELLQSARGPVFGGEVARQLDVSRQVVVQDIALLRSSGHDILATSRGYLLASTLQPHRVRAEVVVRHTPEQTAEELYALVDVGVTIVDVAIEHAVYGELRGGLHLSSRSDVAEFLAKIETGSAHLLSELTSGLHLHTLEASRPEQLERAREELDRLGFLVHD